MAPGCLLASSFPLQQEQEARDAIERAKQEEISRTSAELESWKAKEEQAARILELEEATEREQSNGKSTENRSRSDCGLKKEVDEEVLRQRKTDGGEQRHNKAVSKSQKQRLRNGRQHGGSGSVLE